MKSLLLFVSISLLISGCSDNESSKVSDDASFSGMVDSQAKAMEKAQAIEGVLMDADKKHREQIGQ